MKTIKPTELRDRQKELLDIAAAGELLFVHRPKKRNVYVVSEQDFNTISEQAKAYRNAQYLAKLDRGLEDIQNGKGITMTFEELEKYVDERVNR